MHSPDHSTKGTPSTLGVPRDPVASGCWGVRGFRVSFIPLSGCFSPFPHGTCSLSVARGVEPWRVVPPASHKISRVSWYSGSPPTAPNRPRRDSHPLWSRFPTCWSDHAQMFGRSYNPSASLTGFTGLGSSRFARHYYGNLV